MLKIAMWSGPRNISTALMRSFGSRPDCAVYDEPFYPHYLYQTNIRHPMWKKIIDQEEIDWQRIVNKILGPIPNNKKIWYQKHMAHHNILGCELNWLDKFKNCILIRHPQNVISSYTKRFELKSANQLGYEQLEQLYKILCNMGKVPLVIDASDILIDPQKMLKTICKKLKIPFYNNMLKWEKGPYDYDGIWGKYWYKNVNNSMGFKTYCNSKKNITIHSSIYNLCLEKYEYLYDKRLIL